MRLYYNPDFLRRLGFFLIGTFIGIYFLNKFLEKKKASFPYGPNARTLKSIQMKPYFEYTDEVKKIMKQNNIDTTAVKSLIYFGEVNFKPENRGKQVCNTYLIEPSEKTAPISIDVKRCDSVATVVQIYLDKE